MYEVQLNDDARARLRPRIEDFTQLLGRLGPDVTGDQPANLAALRRSWAEIVELLALGPEPRMRPCPSCGAPGRFEATRCSSCWASTKTVER